MRYKGLNSVITSIILIMLISLATGGCGSGGGAKSDNGQNVAVNPTPVIPDIDLTQSKLNSGKLVTGTPKEDCDNSVVLDSVSELCKLLAPLTGVDACVTQSSSCNSYERQLYTGSVLGPGQKGPNSRWNDRGGSGALMADAAVCTLRELSTKIDGPIDSSASLNIGIGDVVVKQQVGYLDFDRINGRFKGYRKLRIELPVIGKFDAVTQDIDLRRVFYGTGQLFNNIPTAGDYPLLFAYGLNLSTEEKDKSINIDPGSFNVTTPIGDFEVSPHFTYKSNTVVADTPFGTDFTYIIGQDDEGPDAIKLYDLYGVVPGINNNTIPPPSSSGTTDYKEKQSGWVSQIGLGTRGSIDDKLWSPSPGPGGFFTRPDYDPTGLLKFEFYESRSDEENRPSVYAEASASIKYPDNPADMLPDWVGGLPGLDWDAYIKVTPTIKAGAAGQFGINVSEGTDNKKELSGEFYVGKPESRTSALGIYSGVEANASFEVLAELRLYVSAVFDFFIGSKRIDLIDIHPKFPIPIAGGTPVSSNVELATALSSSDNTVVLPETLDYLKTFKGAKNPEEFINLCYAKVTEVPPEEPPVSETEKGDVTDLFEYLPCNICLATDAVTGTKTSDIPAHQEILSPVNPTPPAVWQCDAASKSGCMDLCKLNKETGEFTVVKNPSQIADSIPTTDPDYSKLYPFYKSCMIPCVESAPGILDISCGKGLDNTPPSIIGIMVPGGSGAPAPVPVDTNIAATFSEPMDGTSINETTFTVRSVGVDGDVTYLSGRVGYDADSRTATFTPAVNLDYSATYIATITAGIMDAAGNFLTADFSWSIITVDPPDTIPPFVVSKVPTDDATSVAVNSQVEVVFSEPIDKLTVTSDTYFIMTGDGEMVPGTFSFTDGDTTVIFTPDPPLAYGTTYFAFMTMDVKDPAGNQLQDGVVWLFVTESDSRVR